LPLFSFLLSQQVETTSTLGARSCFTCDFTLQIQMAGVER